MKEIHEEINKFQWFIKDEVGEAVKELEKITSESNRQHLQRLVYVNLVNRFDTLIDSLLLKFSVSDSGFKDKVLKETREEGVFLKDIYEIMLSEDPKACVKQKVEEVTRTRFLIHRHSTKLRQLLSTCFNWADTDLNRPRVFTNNGSIFAKVKKLKPYKVPDTIIGYSDWLYSRRNSLVHGEGKKLAKKDVDYIKRTFQAEPTDSISIKIPSISSAARFYKDLCDKILSTN